MDDPLLNDDARGLVADLTILKQSLATTESLTAGLRGATLAGVPGASELLRGGSRVDRSAAGAARGEVTPTGTNSVAGCVD